jgi:hypothetical protein
MQCLFEKEKVLDSIENESNIFDMNLKLNNCFLFQGFEGQR